MEWNDRLSVGSEIIDSQHQKLLSIINTFYYTLKNPAKQAGLAKTFSELKAYTLYHFAAEENMMVLNVDPQYAFHKQQHLHLIAQLQDLDLRYNKNGDNSLLTAEFCEMLTEWLLTHITEVDQQSAPYFT